MVASLIGLSTRLAREGTPWDQAVGELRAAATMGRSVLVDLLAQARGWHEAMAERGEPQDENSPRAIALLTAAGGVDAETVEREKKEVAARLAERWHSAT